jgi:hypothetical protein
VVAVLAVLILTVRLGQIQYSLQSLARAVVSAHKVAQQVKTQVQVVLAAAAAVSHLLLAALAQQIKAMQVVMVSLRQATVPVVAVAVQTVLVSQEHLRK